MQTSDDQTETIQTKNEAKLAESDAAFESYETGAESRDHDRKASKQAHSGKLQ